MSLSVAAPFVRRCLTSGIITPFSHPRSKGKVERPFQTVKEAHETLYHFHKPETEQQANEWLMRYLLRYNRQDHRSESHSRVEDWLANLPLDGIREICAWEQFCRFAHEPKRRKVGIDVRVSVASPASVPTVSERAEPVLISVRFIIDKIRYQ